MRYVPTSSLLMNHWSSHPAYHRPSTVDPGSLNVSNRAKEIFITPATDTLHLLTTYLYVNNIKTLKSITLTFRLVMQTCTNRTLREMRRLVTKLDCSVTIAQHNQPLHCLPSSFGCRQEQTPRKPRGPAEPAVSNPHPCPLRTAPQSQPPT